MRPGNSSVSHTFDGVMTTEVLERLHVHGVSHSRSPRLVSTFLCVSFFSRARSTQNTLSCIPSLQQEATICARSQCLSLATFVSFAFVKFLPMCWDACWLRRRLRQESGLCSCHCAPRPKSSIRSRCRLVASGVEPRSR